MYEISDAKQRQQAIDITQSFIVQAPAGSGKTELLIQRMLCALAHAHRAPEEVLAITFTNKAAAEMRQRLLGALKQTYHPQQAIPPHQQRTHQLATAVMARSQQLQWDLIENPNRLQIKTIDALNFQICRQAGIMPPAPHAAPMIHYVHTARMFLTDAIAQDDPYVADLLLHYDHHLGHLEKLLAQALSHRDQWLPHIYMGQHDALALANKAYLEQHTQHVCQQFEHICHDPDHQPWIKALQFAFMHLEHHDKPITCPDMDLNSRLRHYQKISDIILTQTGGIRRTVTRKQGFPPLSHAKNKQDKIDFQIQKEEMVQLLSQLNEADPWFMALHALKFAPDLAYPLSYQPILKALNHVLPRLVAYLNWSWSQVHRTDFTHVAMQAQSLLQHTTYCPSDQWIDRRVQLHHLLIDEFQDTSLTQMRLLESLVESWHSHDEQHSIFIVGDPMQSIYRFRQAEATLFEWVTQHGIGAMALQPLKLESNFRSSTDLVQWFNHTFSNIFPKETHFEMGAFPYHASRGTQQTAGEIHTAWFEATSMAAEADHIAQMCQRWSTSDQDHTIAILVRSRRIAQPIITALQKHGIAYANDGLDALSQSKNVQDLIALLSFLRAPYDDLKVAELFCARRIGMSYDALYTLRRLAPSQSLWRTLSQPSQHTEIHAIQDTFAGYIHVISMALKRCTVESMHDVLYVFWRTINPDEAIAHQQDVLRFFDCLQAAEQEQPEQWFEVLMDRLNNTAMPMPTHHNPKVRLCTIHQSKGLEFENVIIPGMGQIVPPRTSKILMLDRKYDATNHLLMLPATEKYQSNTPLHRFMLHRDQARDQQELIRLLYVAATRAKTRLLWTGSCPSLNAIPTRSPLSLLWPHLSTQKQQPHPYQLEDNNDATHWVVQNFNYQPQVSTSHYTDAQAHDDHWMTHETKHQIWGNALHYFMATLMQTRREELPERIQQTLMGCQDMGYGAQERQWIKTQLETHGPAICQHPKVQWLLQRPVTLWTEHPFYDQLGRQHILDLCFYEHGVFWIIDYKTHHLVTDQDDYLKQYYDKMWQYHEVCHKHYKTIKLVLFNPILGHWHPVTQQ